MFPAKLPIISQPTGRKAFTSSYSTVFSSASVQTVNCGDILELNSADQFTISSWSYHTAAAVDQIWSKQASVSNRIYVATVWGDINFYINTSAGNAYGGSAAHTDDVWEHYVVVFDGTQGTPDDRLKVYKDGSPLSLDYSSNDIPAATGDLSGADFLIGGGDVGNMEGNIDDVGLWDVALSADAANVLYNSGTPTDLTENFGSYTSSGDLKGWWKMGDGDTHPTIVDHSGSGYNGTMVNMASSDFVTDVPS